MEDASGTDHVRCGERGWLSLPSPWEVGRGGGIRPERTMSGVVRGLAESSVPVGSWLWRGESGRNELLRGPFALFGVRSSAKLVRDLAKHRRTPMSPPQLIPPTSPVQVIAGTEDSGGGFRGTGHGPFRPLIVSRVKCGGGPCRGHSALPCAGNTISLQCAFIKK